MTKNLSPNTKIRHGSYPGSIRVDERARNTLPRSPIPIAPRPLVYDALQADHIRLLDISPSRDRSTQIRAALKHQSPLHATYRALSYVFRTEELRETIYVNDQPMKVRGSLLDALRDIRSEIENTCIWVDSICINQNDREEKEQQRIRMKEIELHATDVIYWPQVKRRKPDDETLDACLVAGKTSLPHAWDSTLLQIEDIGSQGPLDVMGCQLYDQSPPGLTYSADSSQTNSASSSPVSNEDLHLQPIPTLESLPLRPAPTNIWTFNMEGFDWQQFRLSEEAMKSATNRAQRKRSRLTAFPGDISTSYRQKVQQTQSTGTDSTEQGPSVVFACPFQKAHPQKYHKCLKYTLNRIKDVKQHIYRQHSKPDFYCARCYEVFSSAGDRDAHSRRAECEKCEPIQFEGISEQQRNDLKKPSPKRKPLCEQWFEVWDLLFPGRQRPRSAVIGNHIEEMIPLLRNFWNMQKAGIISELLDSRCGAIGADRKLLADMMDSVFDRFEEDAARSSQGSTTEWFGPETDSLEFPQHAESQRQEADLCLDFETAFDQREFSDMGVHDLETGCAVDMGNYYPPGCEVIGALFDTDLSR